jgi:two-component system sensor histidine kinase KdpD
MSTLGIRPVRSPLSLWLRRGREYALVVAVITGVTALGWCLAPLSYRALGQIYLLAVIALSLRVGRWPALAAAVVSAVTWEYVFVPPRWSFAVSSLEDNLLLGTYFVVALVGGQLSARVHEREKHRAQAELHRTLLDSVSHELKTPLAVLRSAADKIDTDDAAKRARLAAEIRTATLRLDHLVANLLDQTRLESGGLHPQPDWCDARDIIGAARRAVGAALEGRLLRIEIPADLPLFLADAALLEQAVANLLLNAALHTPAATPVNVSAGVGARGTEIFITVADRGPGIPPEIRGHLFQKFRRGDSAQAGGLGLGLGIVRGFMHAQGGEVDANDNPGGGASFTLRLPNIKHGGVPEDES